MYIKAVSWALFQHKDGLSMYGVSIMKIPTVIFIMRIPITVPKRQSLYWHGALFLSQDISNAFSLKEIILGFRFRNASSHRFDCQKRSIGTGKRHLVKIVQDTNATSDEPAYWGIFEQIGINIFTGENMPCLVLLHCKLYQETKTGMNKVVSYFIIEFIYTL